MRCQLLSNSISGRISFARLFKLTKHIALLFYLLSPYLLSCMRGSRNVRKNIVWLPNEDFGCNPKK